MQNCLIASYMQSQLRKICIAPFCDHLGDHLATNKDIKNLLLFYMQIGTCILHLLVAAYWSQYTYTFLHNSLKKSLQELMKESNLNLGYSYTKYITTLPH